jgi:hypothetical protein
MLHAVRDCALYSAILPGSGLKEMTLRLQNLRESKPVPLILTEHEQALLANGDGQHAWYAAHTLLDLAIERLRVTGAGHLTARNLADPNELRVVIGLAEHHGLAACVEAAGSDYVLSVARRPAATPKLIDKMRRDGMSASAEIWWPLYRASHEALAPDSFESRRHAGTIRVEANGRIVGRNDEDETDLAMLAPDPSRLYS